MDNAAFTFFIRLSVSMFRPAFFRFVLSAVVHTTMRRWLRPLSRLSGADAARRHGFASLRRLATPVRIAILVCGAGVALAACSPTYDWRTIMNNDNGYTVDFPAKPGNDQRQIDVGGTPMTMSMQTAEAGNAVFAVGTVMLPGDDSRTQTTALDFLRTGLARNVSASPDVHAVQIALAAGGQVTGFEMKLSGPAGAQQEPRTIYARLVVHGRRAYQVAIVAAKPLPQDQVDEFFQSFQLY
jgi:hypothetical protein